MTGVHRYDLRSIQRFLEDAYEFTAEAVPEAVSCPPGALPRPVLRGLQSLVSADLVESFEMRRGVFEGLPFTTDRDEDELPAGFDDLAVRRYANPISAFVWSPADGPVRLSGLMSRRTLAGLPWHRHYQEPLGIRDQLKVWLWSSTNAAACVSLDRKEGEFDARDVAVLAVLQQHIAAMRESLMTASGGDADRSIEALTVREAQVLSWATRGRRNREIAELLFISPATVRKHLERAYAKLGVRNRAEAAAALRAEADP